MTSAIRRFVKQNPGKGAPRKEAPHSLRREITVGFDGDVFEHIHKQARINRCSFGEQVRTYVEWGMESEKTTTAPDIDECHQVYGDKPAKQRALP